MVATADTETAVIVPVEAADPAVADHRRRLDAAAAWGVGAHVSILVPFVPPAAVDDAVLARLSAAVGAVPAFDCMDAWHTVRAFPLSVPA
jgi:hypothetical protein